uniref:hypothetical protein n=1 Tax=Candidatus Ichthyocystis hellenicum TaxID=1561003 RepID=UPI001111ABE4
MIPGNIVSIGGLPSNEGQEATSSSGSHSPAICKSLQSYAECIGKLSAHAEEGTAEELLENKLSEIGNLWRVLSSRMDEGNHTVRSIERMCHYLSNPSDTETNKIFGASGLSNEEIMLCWADQRTNRNTPEELGSFLSQVALTLEKIAMYYCDSLDEGISSLVQILISILCSYKNTACSHDSLEKILEILVDKGLLKSALLLSCHPDNSDKLKEIVGCFVHQHQVTYLTEKTYVSDTAAVLTSIAGSIGNDNYANAFVGDLNDASRKLPPLLKYELLSDLKLIKLIKLIACSLITADILNFFLHYLEHQGHEEDLLSLKEIKSLLCEKSSNADYLGKILKENLSKAQENSSNLNLMLAQSMVSAIIKHSPVTDEEGNPKQGCAVLNKKSVTILSAAKDFVSNNGYEEEQLRELMVTELGKISWNTERTSITVLESSISIFGHFNLPQEESIRGEFLAKVACKIEEIAKNTSVTLEDLVEVRKESKSTHIIKLLSIFRILKVELLYLPNGITSEAEIFQKAISMLSSEKARRSLEKILSSKTMLATEKVLLKMSTRTTSSAPKEISKSLSALKRLICRTTRSEHRLARSVSHVSKDKKRATRDLVLNLMGFNYCKKLKYYYQTCGELPADYLRHIKNSQLPATKSDMRESFTVDAGLFSFSETLCKDINRCNYVVGGRELSIDCENKSNVQISHELMVKFIAMATDIGLTKDIIERAASFMNQSIAAVMVGAGYRASHHMFPPGSGLGIGETLSGGTIFTLERSKSGGAAVTCSISGRANIILVQDPNKKVDIEADIKSHRRNNITVVPSDEETLSCLEEIKLSSSMSVEIEQDGSIKVTNFSYEANGLSP